MRLSYFIGMLVTLAACQPRAGAADKVVSHPERIGFLSQCSFSNEVKAILVYHFNSDSYRFIIRHSDTQNDLSTLRPRSDGTIDLDTNGGVGKMEGVSRLFNWLLQQKFDAVTPEEFSSQMVRRDVPRCPGKYPFSP